jgi:predicted MFS family arabinose efflux permease
MLNARITISTGWSRAVGPLGIGAFAIGTDLFVVAGLLPPLTADLGVTMGAAGLTVTVFALAYATGAPVLSALFGLLAREVGS